MRNRKDIPNHRIAERYENSVLEFLMSKGPSRPSVISAHCYPKHLKRGYELQWVNKVLLRLLKQDKVRTQHSANDKSHVVYYYLKR